MRATFVIALAVLSAVASFGQQGTSGTARSTSQVVPPTPQAQSADLGKKKEAWQEALRKTFKNATFSVAVDVPDFAAPAAFEPETYLSESEYLGIFASSLKRAVFSIGEVKVIARSIEATKANSGRRLIADWLSKVPDTELRNLASGSMAFSELSPPSRALFMGLCTDPGVREKMSSGQLVAVSLRASFMAEVGGTSSCINPLDRDSDGEETLRTSLKGSYQPPKPVAWPKHSPEGKLDFPKGEVLAAKELIQRATKAFGVNYVFDNRIADNLIFCQGKFDDKSFLKILNQLTIPFNAIPAPSPDADSKLIQDQFRRKVFPLLDESLFPPGTDRSSLEGKSLTVAELSKLNSTFAQIADRDKRDGNDSVKVSAIPCFYAVAVSDRIEDATLRWSMMIRP